MNPKVLLIAVALSVGLVPSASFADQSALGRMMVNESDIIICNKVWDALQAQKNLHIGEIQVTAFKGSVQLSGYVRSSDELTKAALVAQKVRGVAQVKNDLLLKGEIRV
ncbi:MAG: BON domain-containing protein [Pseudomonadota bacterium]